MKSFVKTKKGKIIIAVISFVLIAAISICASVYYEHSRYFCQYAKVFSYSEIKAEKKPVLVAHRGAAVLAPENTLPAYEKAAQSGFKYAETDIRATKDGVWVLTHDNSLKRMTGFKGKVEEMNLTDVLSHKITKGGNVENYPDLYTPTLDEFLALCKQKGINPVLEIKTSPENRPDAPFGDILKLVKKHSLYENTTIISFDYEALEIIRAVDSEIKMQLLTKEMNEEALTKAEKLGGCGIDCEYKSMLKNADLVKLAKNNGFVLNAWTVDEKSAARKLCDIGVDFITTNAIYY